jgi:hypothetical protein
MGIGFDHSSGGFEKQISLAALGLYYFIWIEFVAILEF